MNFRVNLTIEMDKPSGSMAVKTSVPMMLIYQHGRWQAQSVEPPVMTEVYSTLEEALVAGAKELKTLL